jgi:hypothetical protein
MGGQSIQDLQICTVNVFIQLTHFISTVGIYVCIYLLLLSLPMAFTRLGTSPQPDRFPYQNIIITMTFPWERERSESWRAINTWIRLSPSLVAHKILCRKDQLSQLAISWARSRSLLELSIFFTPYTHYNCKIIDKVGPVFHMAYPQESMPRFLRQRVRAYLRKWKKLLLNKKINPQ